jgi:hypothetical protein
MEYRSMTANPIKNGEPADASLMATGTGSGSVMAELIALGGSVSRHTEQGTIKPFGLDVGTADDATALDAQFAHRFGLASDA